MRIGLVTTGYPHARSPVPGSFVRGMARALVARGHTVRVVCAARRDDRPVTDPGIDVVTVRSALLHGDATPFGDAGAPDALFDRPRLSAWLGAATFAASLPRSIATTLRDCDAIVSHFLLPGALAAGLARMHLPHLPDALAAGLARMHLPQRDIARGPDLARMHVPHLAIAHGTDAWLLALMPAAVQRAVLASASAIQFTSTAARDAMDRSVAHDARVFVEPMGFDPATATDRTRARDALGLARDEVLVLAVARAVRVKGLDVLVEAAARVPAHVRVVIAGDGPERAALVARAGRTVRFVGAVDAHARDALLAAADVFVAPSRPLGHTRTDGAPVALLEAMGAGLAVIASHTGGLGELVGDAGLLVPPADPHALSHAIARLANDPMLRASLAARARHRAAPFRWPAAAARLEARLARQPPSQHP